MKQQGGGRGRRCRKLAQPEDSLRGPRETRRGGRTQTPPTRKQGGRQVESSCGLKAVQRLVPTGLVPLADRGQQRVPTSAGLAPRTRAGAIDGPPLRRRVPTPGRLRRSR